MAAFCPAGSALAASPFPDKNLEAAIRNVLKHEPNVELTDEKLQNVYILEAPEKGIKDLTGLEKCKNLALLKLTKNQITRPEAAQGPDQPRVARPGRQRDQGHRPAGQPQGAAVHRALEQQGRERDPAGRADRPDVALPGGQRDQGHRAPGPARQALVAVAGQEPDQGHRGPREGEQALGARPAGQPGRGRRPAGQADRAEAADDRAERRSRTSSRWSTRPRPTPTARSGSPPTCGSTSRGTRWRTRPRRSSSRP